MLNVNSPCSSQPDPVLSGKKQNPGRKADQVGALRIRERPGMSRASVFGVFMVKRVRQYRLTIDSVPSVAMLSSQNSPSSELRIL